MDFLDELNVSDSDILEVENESGFIFDDTEDEYSSFSPKAGDPSPEEPFNRLSYNEFFNRKIEESFLTKFVDSREMSDNDFILAFSELVKQLLDADIKVDFISEITLPMTKIEERKHFDYIYSGVSGFILCKYTEIVEDIVNYLLRLDCDIDTIYLPYNTFRVENQILKQWEDGYSFDLVYKIGIITKQQNRLQILDKIKK